MTTRRLPAPGIVFAATAAGLFAVFALQFYALAVLFTPGLAQDLGWGRVAAANALAALAMAAFLTRFAGPRAPRAREDMPKP